MEVGALFEFVQELVGDEPLVHEEVGLARGVEVEGGVGFADGEDVDAFHGDAVAVPVMGVAFKPDAVVDAPLFQDVGAVADEFAGLGPVVGEAFDRGEVDRGEGDEGAEVEEVGGGVFEGDFEGGGVEGADADLGEIGDAALVEVARAAQVVELRGIFGAGGGVEGAPPGTDKVVGGDGVAVAPAGVAAQVKGVDPALRADLPAFGDAGDGLCGGVEGGQAFKEGVGDAALGLAGDEGGVERFGFGSVEEDEIGASGRGATPCQ